MILLILSCMSVVKFFVLVVVLVNSCTALYTLLVVGGRSVLFKLNILLKLDNMLLCYSFAHVNLFSARSQLYTPLL